MTTTKDNITIAQVRTLRDQAGSAGDHEQVAVCELALTGDPPTWLDEKDPIRRMTRDDAIAACARVLATLATFLLVGCSCPVARDGDGGAGSTSVSSSSSASATSTTTGKPAYCITDQVCLGKDTAPCATKLDGMIDGTCLGGSCCR
jgi:hypothetical protein